MKLFPRRRSEPEPLVEEDPWHEIESEDAVCVMGGPWHGRVCYRWEGWPLRWEPFSGSRGAYLLGYVWCEDGAPSEDIVETDEGVSYLESAFGEPE